MLAKINRLTTAEFNSLFRSSNKKRSNGKYVQCIYSPADDFKVAVVVGKKVHKKAVKRNALKRVIYEKLRTSDSFDLFRGRFIFVTLPNASLVSKKKIADDALSVLAFITKL